MQARKGGSGCHSLRRRPLLSCRQRQPVPVRLQATLSFHMQAEWGSCPVHLHPLNEVRHGHRRDIGWWWWEVVSHCRCVGVWGMQVGEGWLAGILPPRFSSGLPAMQAHTRHYQPQREE